MLWDEQWKHTPKLQDSFSFVTTLAGVCVFNATSLFSYDIIRLWLAILVMVI